WEQSPWTSHGLAPWLWVAAAAVVAAIVRLVRGMLRSASAGAAGGMGGVAAGDGYIQPGGRDVAGVAVYSAFVLPRAVSVGGTSFWNSLATMSARRFVMCGGVASAGIAIVWSDYATAWTPLWPHAIPIVATLGGVLLALAIMPRLRTVGALCGIAGLVLFASEIRYLPKRQNS